jgi:hypothetical protein
MRMALRLLAGPAGASTSGGSREQPGQQRVFLAHGLVGNDGDLAIARGSDEGDDTTTLEEAEDALARTTHKSLDLVLRGRGRRVEHLALAVAIWGVHTVQENGVQMRIESQIAVCALNDCHGAGFADRQAAVNVPASDTIQPRCP